MASLCPKYVYTIKDLKRLKYLRSKPKNNKAKTHDFFNYDMYEIIYFGIVFLSNKSDKKY